MTDYADLLGGLERMLSDREIGVLLEMGARMLRATRPELLRTTSIDDVYQQEVERRSGTGRPVANSSQA